MVGLGIIACVFAAACYCVKEWFKHYGIIGGIGCAVFFILCIVL